MTNPSRLNEEHRHLPKKSHQHQNLATQDQVPAKTPPMPQPRPPPTTPLKPPQDPKQPTTQNPDEDTPPDLTEYVKAYQQAGKLWLDTVVENKEQAYITLFDTLQQLGNPHIDNLDQADREQSVFLDIITQVQLPAVQVSIRTVEELEKLEGKTYRELTLLCHLPNFRRIFHNATEQTRAMAAYMYFVLHEQITGLRPSQTGCGADFRCGVTPFKRLITGKKQPGGPGRSSEVRGGSSRRLEEVTEMEGTTPAKQRKTTPTPKPTGGRGRGRKG